MLELTTAETFFYTLSMATSNLWQYLKGLTARNNSSDNNANQFFLFNAYRGEIIYCMYINVWDAANKLSNVWLYLKHQQKKINKCSWLSLLDAKVLQK